MRDRLAVHDVVTDEAVTGPPLRVPEAGLLVVDGLFLQRPELTDAWDHVIFLDVPFEVSVARMAAPTAPIPTPTTRTSGGTSTRSGTTSRPAGRARAPTS